MRRATTGAALAALACLGLGQADAQPQGLPPQGVMSPYVTEGPMVDAHGDPAVMPASYGAPCGPGCYGHGGGMGGGMPSGMGGGMGMPCGPMDGGMGGGMGGGPASLGAFGPGAAMNTEQCGPHYFDFAAEYVQYTLNDDVLGGSTVFSTFGFANTPGDVANQRAITGGDLDAGTSNGYRLIGRFDVGALSVFEASYTGLYGANAEAVALGGSANPNPATQTLFSVFSGFGTAITGPDAPNPSLGGDFEETDNALEHRLRYESELHTGELNFRRYWVGFNPRVSGTWLVGFRYTSLEESLGFYSRAAVGANPPNVAGTPKSINAVFEADNRLAGVQAGGDGWITVLQGFRVGGEFKLGLMSNDFQVSAATAASDGTPSSVLGFEGSEVAFLTEAKLMGVVNLTPSLSLKGGYELLYISDVVRAGEGFLTGAGPYSTAPPVLTNDDEVFYHGWHVGGEYIF
ncbi:BBP7 family outer membrane beta-barrel protein [Botrimarina hoheduenensis]|uniref:Porin n=1 Tax=Botrimarina hoheduenensis TaxID=2528000 RepID=A0A5C5WFC2_9BACT|nr:BBP7 family outer membrane beta-barrel protein [Botrimarina hoheduenensis]TWT48462.1 hypothetical protein Pla111_02300 [Botrimarina hoheduenensis]